MDKEVYSRFVENYPTASTYGNVKQKTPEIAEVQQLITSGDKMKIKKMLRDSNWPPNHPTRTQLWLLLSDTTRKDNVNIYQETVREVQNDGVSLPAFVDLNHQHFYKLSENGKATARRVIWTLSHTHPEITWAPSLLPLVALFLHYMREDEAFQCADALLRRSADEFVTQTRSASEAGVYVLAELTKRKIRPAYSSIARSGVNLEQVLQNWLWWMLRDLPFSHLVRVIDCFLWEGSKVLYRVALAIVQLYNKHTATTHSGKNSNIYEESAIGHFCQNLPASPDKVLRMAFGVSGLARKDIMQLKLSYELRLKGVPKETPAPNVHTLQESQESAGDVTQNNKVDKHQATTSQAVRPFASVTSDLLTMDMWSNVWKWLPARMTLLRPRRYFTTAEDGTSLRTLYSKIEGHEPILMVLRSTEGQIIGAYCSSDWANRLNNAKNLSYFGTGETFVFTLSPRIKMYPWVGVRLGDDTPTSAHQFQAGDNTKITIGGGSGEALQIDPDLDLCRTQACDTFENLPLHTPSDFRLAALEAFGFHDVMGD